jgi:hypothetical protein
MNALTNSENIAMGKIISMLTAPELQEAFNNHAMAANSFSPAKKRELVVIYNNAAEADKFRNVLAAIINIKAAINNVKSPLAGGRRRSKRRVGRSKKSRQSKVRSRK